MITFSNVFYAVSSYAVTSKSGQVQFQLTVVGQLSVFAVWAHKL